MKMPIEMEIDATTAASVAYVLAQIADVVTTMIALRKPGLIEGNPVSAYLMSKIGHTGWILVKLALAFGALYLLIDYDLIWPVWVIAGLVGAVAVWNYRLIK